VEVAEEGHGPREFENVARAAGVDAQRKVAFNRQVVNRG
jgi:hypothetical protein